ncbi:hypothetical protein [Bacillus cereus]|nr:hypothetical protein [Bacillus cereus]MBL3774958.1 hypothetical protein [Bacillus cereus]MBL3780783.1 hypothetical protein [Bacillus cereus]MBL3792063.1 hypothetical protein [Bacillus cereus]
MSKIIREEIEAVRKAKDNDHRNNEQQKVIQQMVNDEMAKVRKEFGLQG